MSYFNFAPDEAQGEGAQWPRFPLTFFAQSSGLDSTCLFKGSPGYKRGQGFPKQGIMRGSISCVSPLQC